MAPGPRIYGQDGVRDRSLKGERDERRFKDEEKKADTQREERWLCAMAGHQTEDLCLCILRWSD